MSKAGIGQNVKVVRKSALTTNIQNVGTQGSASAAILHGARMSTQRRAAQVNLSAPSQLDSRRTRAPMTANLVRADSSP